MEVEAFFPELLALARSSGFAVETIASLPPAPVIALIRPGKTENLKVYLSAGIHGDETAGPLAILKLLREKKLHPDIGWHICPVLNPWGLARNRRDNEEGLDLNRDYKSIVARQTGHHIDWLKRQNTSFSLCLTLHEDCDTEGFYLYELNELNPDNLPSLVPAIMEAGGKPCGIDQSPVIDGCPAKNGVLHLPTDLEARPEWTETAYLVANHSRMAYTLEAPGKKKLHLQIETHTAGVEAAINHFRNNF